MEIIGYKLTHIPGKVNVCYGENRTRTINERHTSYWFGYQKWIKAGNEPEPYQTDEEKLKALQFKTLKVLKNDFKFHLENGCDISLGFKIDSKLTDVSFLAAAYINMTTFSEESILISDHDNKIHQLTSIEFKDTFQELGIFIKQALEKKWNLRGQILNSNLETDFTLLKW